MSSLTRFEEIRAWQEARKLVRTVYGMTREGAFARDFGLRDQIQRAAVSVMTNIAEGFGARSNPSFQQFLTYARRSALEVQSLLYVAIDVGYISEEQFRKTIRHNLRLLHLINFCDNLVCLGHDSTKETTQP
ncbi:MAG: hypothetical protein Fur0018_19080 [Anaerolineales bacterium]